MEEQRQHRNELYEISHRQAELERCLSTLDEMRSMLVEMAKERRIELLVVHSTASGLIRGERRADEGSGVPDTRNEPYCPPQAREER